MAKSQRGMQRYIDANKELWNTWTGIHVQSPFYDVEGFKAGKIRLHATELAEVGEVRGKSLLHLQCHFGLDTMSWTRHGARATGLDFSDKAIDYARSLAAELSLDTHFVCADLYAAPEHLHEEFDIVYTSQGVLWWLPDLDRWAEIVAHFLKPGGFFYLYEFHPFGNVFDQDDKLSLKPTYPYLHGPEPLRFDTDGSYAGVGPRGVEYGWDHMMGDVINALIKAGLHLEWLHEFSYCTYQRFPILVQADNGNWVFPPELENMVPLQYSIRAHKD